MPHIKNYKKIKLNVLTNPHLSRVREFISFDANRVRLFSPQALSTVMMTKKQQLKKIKLWRDFFFHANDINYFDDVCFILKV